MGHFMFCMGIFTACVLIVLPFATKEIIEAVKENERRECSESSEATVIGFLKRRKFWNTYLYVSVLFMTKDGRQVVTTTKTPLRGFVRAGHVVVHYDPMNVRHAILDEEQVHHYM